MLFLKPKCSDCGKRDVIVHSQTVYTMTNGTLNFSYCKKCYEERNRKEDEFNEKNRQYWEPIYKEKERQRRYEYLKREIELRELEKKAKELGIK